MLRFICSVVMYLSFLCGFFYQHLLVNKDLQEMLIVPFVVQIITASTCLIFEMAPQGYAIIP